MAKMFGNPFERPEGSKGFNFEFEVGEYIRQHLPEQYYYRHSLTLSGPDKTGKSVAREIDLVVVGPNGVFLIDAKKAEGRVEGSLFEQWTFIEKQNNKIERKYTTQDRPGETMRRRLTQLGQLIKKTAKRVPALDPYQFACSIFVFPDGVELAIKMPSGPPSSHQFKTVHLSKELIDLILSWHPAIKDAKALNEKQIEELLALFRPEKSSLPDITHIYQIVHKGRVQTAPNDLRYRVDDLAPLDIGQMRRGKWYDMSQLGTKDRDDFDAQIRRHFQILAMFEGHPHIHRYIQFFPDYEKGGYYLIEEWIEGETLEEIMRHQRVRDLNLREVMRGVALALKSLHAPDPARDKPILVHRVLNPSAIIIERETQRAVLTNFELARAESWKTVVRDKFSANPYCAPELVTDPHSATPRSDLYSWGAILFELSTGQQYRHRSHLILLKDTNLPSDMQKVVEACLNLVPSRRPESIDNVLEAVNQWARAN